jgi:hypothetical protein
VEAALQKIGPRTANNIIYGALRDEENSKKTTKSP